MKFSIFNLLLIIATVAALAALYSSRQKNIENIKRYEALIAEQKLAQTNLQTELRELRQEYGYLEITNPRKIHAVKIRSVPQNAWCYRVYLPKGQNYYFACQINSLPLKHELPSVAKPTRLGTIGSLGRNSTGIGIPSGEYVVTLSVSQLDSEWSYRLNVRPAGDAGDGSSGAGRINDQTGKWPNANKLSGLFRGGVSNQKEFSADGAACLLLDLRAFEKSSADSDQGAMLWVGPAN